MSRRHLMIYLDDYINGDLDPENRAIIEQYLEGNPQERVFVEREKSLRSYLSELATPDPGENYWKDLNKRIDEKVRQEAEIVYIKETRKVVPELAIVAKYLAPLAAALILFIGSLSFVDMQIFPMTEIASQDYSEELNSDRNREYYAKYSLEFELIGSTVLGPPGSVGRKMVIFEIIGGSN